MHDGCPTYTCVKNGMEYVLFRYCLSSKQRRWYISHSPEKGTLGTKSDVDFYYTPSSVEHKQPPEENWKAWRKNRATRAPAPTVRLYVPGTAGSCGGGADGDSERASSDTSPCLELWCDGAMVFQHCDFKLAAKEKETFFFCLSPS